MGTLFQFSAPVIQFVGVLVEYIGMIIIVGAIVVSLVQLIGRHKKRGAVRSELANNIMFGLEFIIAADILLVTVAVSLNEILQLGGIVLIRIMLGYTIRKETMR